MSEEDSYGVEALDKLRVRWENPEAQVLFHHLDYQYEEPLCNNAQTILKEANGVYLLIRYFISAEQWVASIDKGTKDADDALVWLFKTMEGMGGMHYED